MFFATALLYPCVLAALCLGAGLALDRLSGSFLAGSLLVAVGAASLIALSQLSTYVSGLAPATPYLMAALALAGFAVSRERAAELAKLARRRAWPIAASLLACAIALAPVLAAGRTTFSSFMTLSDSAVHLLGADYLLHHGQHYAHLDLRNSYGQFVNDYYNSSYPSGADTLFGGSSFLLGLPLIWSFQPFNAFMLAAAVGPAWFLARKLGLNGSLAALAALTASLPALVYAYELFGSVKEISSLSMLLTLGCLVVSHRGWLREPRRAIPFALVVAGGTSALGVAFGAWALVAAVVLAAVLADDLAHKRLSVRAAALTVGGAALVLAVAAWPTWHEFAGSLKVAQDIASTGNSGNLSSPLRAVQVLGVWLNTSYKLQPAGAALTMTHILMAVTVLAAALGLAHVTLRTRSYALAGWWVGMLVAWLVVSQSVTTWASAKTLMLTSPVVVLMAWGGVAALKSMRALGIPAAVLLALALAGGALDSDALQYRASDVAPTARYEELASLDARFAGEGPTLFTDFDEYSMYELRDLDVGGPDFVYPPSTLSAAAGGYGQQVNLNRVAPAALTAYPLIVTRRDPSAPRPPAAYTLVWQGSYYQVWHRIPGAEVPLRHVALSGSAGEQCEAIGRVARQAGAGATTGAGAATLVAAQAPQLVRVSLAGSMHPRNWGHQRGGLVMKHPGQMTAYVNIPHGGTWDVWVQGQIMPRITLAIDARQVASIAGELAGNSLVLNTAPPIAVRLSAGTHRVTVTRPAFNLSAGDEGSAVLAGIFLTPANSPLSVLQAPVARWRELCGGEYQWVELLAGR